MVVTRETESRTREIKRLRVAAAKRGESVDLDDVDAEADINKHNDTLVKV